MEIFIIDVDGVLTTGQFLYSSEGKVMKIFGPDDNEALSLIEPYLKIQFITADKNGYAISKKRIVDHMKYPLSLVSSKCRLKWIQKKCDPLKVIYMGDGLFDHIVMNKVGYSIAPANADKNAKISANFVTERKGGDRALAEACMHINEKFFTT